MQKELINAIRQVVREEVSGIKQDLSDVKDKVTTIDHRTKNTEKKMDAILKQTGILTEFRTETDEKNDEICDDLDFIKHKQYENEKEIYKLKKRIKS